MSRRFENIPLREMKEIAMNVLNQSECREFEVDANAKDGIRLQK